MQAAIEKASQGVSDAATGALSWVFSPNHLTSENFWMGLPMIGEVYIIGLTLFENLGWEHIGMKPAQPLTELQLVELNDKSAKRFFNYALMKVVSWVALSIFAVLPLVGAFVSATSTLSFALYVVVILTQGYFYNVNADKRAQLTQARLQQVNALQ